MLLAVGAAHIDRRGQVSGRYLPGASNPGTMREEIGGGVFNALRNATRHGVHGALMSLRGGDAASEAVGRAIDEAGIEDLSASFLDRTTPSYTALLDEEGELIAGFADMGLYDIGFAKQIRRRKFRDAVGRAEAILCDANMPEAALLALMQASAGKPVNAVAISPAKVTRLAPCLDRLACLFMNLREARTLSGRPADAMPANIAAAIRGMGLASAVITAGSHPLVGFDLAGMFELVPAAPRQVADVTGAGDAIAGATTAIMMQGLPLRQAVRYGMAAAMLTLESRNVVATYSDQDFADALALVGEARAVA